MIGNIIHHISLISEIKYKDVSQVVISVTSGAHFDP